MAGVDGDLTTLSQALSKDIELRKGSIATREVRRYSPEGVSSRFPVAGQPWVVLRD